MILGLILPRLNIIRLKKPLIKLEGLSIFL